MVPYYMYENKKDKGHTGFQFFHGRQEDIPSITCVPPRTVRYVPWQIQPTVIMGAHPCKHTHTCTYVQRTCIVEATACLVFARWLSPTFLKTTRNI